jgi:hypothetical protein
MIKDMEGNVMEHLRYGSSVFLKGQGETTENFRTSQIRLITMFTKTHY